MQPWVNFPIVHVAYAANSEAHAGIGKRSSGGDPEALRDGMELPDLGFRWPKFLLSLPGMIPVLVAHSPRRAAAWMSRVQVRNNELIRTDFRL